MSLPGRERVGCSRRLIGWAASGGAPAPGWQLGISHYQRCGGGGLAQHAIPRGLLPHEAAPNWPRRCSDILVNAETGSRSRWNRRQNGAGHSHHSIGAAGVGAAVPRRSPARGGGLAATGPAGRRSAMNNSRSRPALILLPVTAGRAARRIVQMPIGAMDGALTNWSALSACGARLTSTWFASDCTNGAGNALILRHLAALGVRRVSGGVAAAVPEPGNELGTRSRRGSAAALLEAVRTSAVSEACSRDLGGGCRLCGAAAWPPRGCSVPTALSAVAAGLLGRGRRGAPDPPVVPEGSLYATLALINYLGMRNGITASTILHTFGVRGNRSPATAVMCGSLNVPLILARGIRFTSLAPSSSRRCRLVISRIINSASWWLVVSMRAVQLVPQVGDHGRLRGARERFVSGRTAIADRRAVLCTGSYPPTELLQPSGSIRIVPPQIHAEPPHGFVREISADLSGFIPSPPPGVGPAGRSHLVTSTIIHCHAFGGVGGQSDHTSIASHRYRCRSLDAFVEVASVPKDVGLVVDVLRDAGRSAARVALLLAAMRSVASSVVNGHGMRVAVEVGRVAVRRGVKVRAGVRDSGNPCARIGVEGGDDSDAVARAGCAAAASPQERV